MNYSQIEAFVDLVETKSFSQTAHRLSVSQPAISQRIHALEKSLDCQLFERRGDELIVTQTGSYLYTQGKAIIALWKTTYQHMQEIKNSPYGSLTIGASTIPSQFFISPLIKTFRSKYPHIQIQVQVAGTDQVVQWLFDKQVDVAIIGSTPIQPKGLTIFPIAKDRLVLIVPINHPWASTQNIALEELQHSTFIVREKQSGTRKILEQALATRGVDIDSLSVLGEFGSTDAVVAAVESGLGVSFVSQVAAERASNLQRVKIVPIKDFAIERDLYCAINDSKRSESTTKFLEFLEEDL